MVENPAYDYDDEIDLREIALTLWKGRWLILALTLIAALLAYAVSAWLLPRQYQATAYITIGQPQVQYTSSNSLLFLPATPDIKALPDLLMAEAILEQVAGDPRIAPRLASDEARLTGKMQVDTLGTTQLRFRVTDTDAERAATLANVWAEKAADWIESAYGLGALTATLDTQISQTQQDYAQAQSALETFLAQDQRPVLQSQLNAQRDTYSCLERRVIAADTLLKRLGEMETRLVQSDEPLSLSDAILLASIQQDIDSLETCGSSATILQSSSPMLFAGISSTRGLEVITGYRQSLEQRIADTRHEQEALQEEVLKLQVEIEQLGYQNTKYTRQRDQAAELYYQLTYQQALVENVLQQSGRVAHVSVEAVAPQRPSSPRPAVNAVLAGMGMAVLVGAIVLLRATWSEPK